MLPLEPEVYSQTYLCHFLSTDKLLFRLFGQRYGAILCTVLFSLDFFRTYKIYYFYSSSFVYGSIQNDL